MIVVTYKEYNNICGLVEKTAMLKCVEELRYEFEESIRLGNPWIIIGVWEVRGEKDE